MNRDVDFFYYICYSNQCFVAKSCVFYRRDSRTEMKTRDRFMNILSDRTARAVLKYTYLFGLLAHGVALLNKFSWHDELQHGYKLSVARAVPLGRWLRAFLGNITSKLFGGYNLSLFYCTFGLSDHQDIPDHREAAADTAVRDPCYISGGDQHLRLYVYGALLFSGSFPGGACRVSAQGTGKLGTLRHQRRLHLLQSGDLPALCGGCPVAVRDPDVLRYPEGLL